MSNTFVKMMNNSVTSNYNSSVINDIQKDLHIQTKALGQQLYNDIINKLNNSSENVDINTVLKCYLLEQLLVSKEIAKKNIEYTSTQNPDIKFNSENKKYYITKDNQNIEVNNIAEIYEDGSYAVIEQKRNSTLKIKKIYSKAHEVNEIQILFSNGKYETNQYQAAEFLEFKKLYSQRYKYSGFSGNSTDFIASIKNKLSSPIDTEMFLDKYCNCYKWSFKKKAFVRNISANTTSPLLVDYEYLSNGSILKKEYTGIK